MMSVYPRHLPTPEQHGHSPQRHTAAGTAAPTTADIGNKVQQRANSTQTAYAQSFLPHSFFFRAWTWSRPSRAPRLGPATGRSSPSPSPPSSSPRIKHLWWSVWNACQQISRGMWCLWHAGALAWRRGPVCACTRVCWCRRISTSIHAYESILELNRIDIVIDED